MCWCGGSTARAFFPNRKQLVAGGVEKALKTLLRRALPQLLWLKLEPVLNAIALNVLLHNPRTVVKLADDTVVYVTKIKEAFVVGLLTRF